MVTIAEDTRHEQEQAHEPFPIPDTAFDRYRRALLGPKLVWLRQRLWVRHWRYMDEVERLEASSPDEWNPRVMFISAGGGSLLKAVDRRKDAIALARAKVGIAFRRYEAIQSTFWERDRERKRLARENTLLRQFVAPKRRGGRT